MPAIKPAPAAALQIINLFAQRFHFLLGQLVILLSLLQRRDDPLHIAQNGFKAVANPIDLSAQHAIHPTIAAAFIPPPATVAFSTTIIAAAIPPTTHITRTIRFTRTQGRTFPSYIFTALAIGNRSAFVERIGLMRFIRNGFGNTFALRSFVNRLRHICIVVRGVVMRRVFAFARRLTKIIIFTRDRSTLLTKPSRRRRIIFARRTVVSTTATAPAPRGRTSSTPAAPTSAAIAITPGISAALSACRTHASFGRTTHRSRSNRLRFRVTMLRSGMRGRRGFPSFERGLSRRFGGAFRAA